MRARDFENYDFAIFDCDGVILDSNSMKSEAFGLALSDESENLVSEFVTYHQNNGGVSRYVKFEHFFKNIKNCSNYEADLERALEEYARLSKRGLLACAEIPGVNEFLRRQKAKHVPCFVVSGGDEVEVNEVFAARKLTELFKRILGSPRNKNQNIEKLYEDGLLSGRGVFFGDAHSDLKAAAAYDLDFVFVSGTSDWVEGKEICSKNSCDCIADFTGLMDVEEIER